MRYEKRRSWPVASGGLVGAFHEAWGAPYKVCLAPGGSCDSRDIRKAHAIQRGRVLALIQERGFVVMPEPKPEARLDRPPSAPRWREFGHRVATTFTGLCDKHDNDLFRPIDDFEFVADDEEQKFLLAYRCVLRQTHAAMRARAAARDTYAAAVGSRDRNHPGLVRELGRQAQQAAYNARRHLAYKARYDAVFGRRGRGSLVHETIRMPATAPLVAASTTLFAAGEGDGGVGITLNLFPHGAGHLLVVSYLNDHECFGQRLHRPLMESRGRQRLERVSRRILRDCETVAVKPGLWWSLPESQRDAIREYFFATISDRGFDPEDPRLNLFESAA